MISCKAYSLPLSIPYRWSKGTHTNREGLIVRIDIDGHIGWGEAILPPNEPFDAVKEVTEVERLVAGLDDQTQDFLVKLDERNPSNHLRCGISTAWLSAQASISGQSLASYLIDAERDPVIEVPINGFITENSIKEVVSRAQSEVQHGFTTLKVKCVGDDELDRQKVAAIRKAVPNAKLRLDPNEAWGTNTLSRLELMSQYDIEYVEQPLPVESSLEQSANLRKLSPIPIALDQSVTSVKAAKNILDNQAADVLILKAPAIGGFDRIVEISRMAEKKGVACVISSGLETIIGRTASIHCASIMPKPLLPSGLSLGRFFKEDLTNDVLKNNGVYHLPQKSGLGIDVSTWWGA